MNKKAKALLEKAKESPQSISFREVQKLAEYFGFVFDSQNGTSHVQYKRRDDPYGFMNFQTNPKDKKMAKVYQVRQLVKFITNNNLEEE